MIILISETRKELKVGDVIEESVSDCFSFAVVRSWGNFSNLRFMANDVAHCGVFALCESYAKHTDNNRQRKDESKLCFSLNSPFRIRISF